MRPTVAQLGALAVSAALLAGLPALALQLEWPDLPEAATAWAYLRSATPPPGLVTAVSLAVLWAVWGLYVLAVAAEVLQRASARGARARRPLGPLQVVAATALGALLSAPAAQATTAPASQTSTADPDTADADTPTPPAAEDDGPPEAAESATGLTERSRTLDGFGYDSTEVTEDMEADLAPVVGMIADHGAAGVPVVITGHTDAAGDPDYNRDLAQRRAEAVAEYLRDQAGATAPEMEVRGAGAAALLDDHEADDAAQRRVEITYTVATPPPPPEPDEAEAPSGGSTEEPTPESAQGSEARPVIAVEIPSAAATGAAAAAAAAGGFALGRRRPEGRAPADDEALHEAEASEGEAEEEAWPPPMRRRDAPAFPLAADAGWRTPTDTAPAEDDEEAEALSRAAPIEPEASAQARPLLDADTTTPPLDAGGGASERLEVDPARLRGVLGLTGTGAPGAARTALAAIAGRTGVRIIATAADLDRLLGTDTPVSAASRVFVAEDTDEALHHLHAELLTRLDADADDDAQPASSYADEPDASPPVLLIATADRATTQRTEELLAADGAPVAALLLSRWPQRALTIDHLGTVTGGDGDTTALHGAHWPLTGRAATHTALHASAPLPAPAHAPQSPGETQHDADPAAEPVGASTFPAKASGEAPAQPARSARPVRLQVLGRIRITVHGAPAAPRRRTALEIATYLSQHPDGVRLDAAIEDMWPAEQVVRATRRAHDAISALRAATRTAGSDVVLREGDYYRLNPAAVDVDLWDLEALLDSAPAPTALVGAAQTYTDFAAEADYPWAEPRRRRVRDRFVRALIAAGAEADPHRARVLLEHAVRIAPDDEEAHHALIRHLAQTDTEAALAAYADYSAAMADLDAQMDPAISALIAQRR
ncbi:OmpA family protein [Nocardiopsis coralliicola]